MGSLNYFELSKEKARELTPDNNKGIIKIVMEDEYEESDYKEISHMMKSSSISLSDLQGE